MARLVKLSIALLLSAPFLAPRAGAQVEIGLTDRDPDSVFKFNLSTPGARSLAMGGAFVALADDATAAYTNPAGLTNLTVGGSEVTVEVRQVRIASPFTDGGHMSAVPGTEPFAWNIGIDNVNGLQREEATSELTGLSFLSVGWVLPRGLTLAFYRHELANFESLIETQGPFVDKDSAEVDEFDLDEDGDMTELYCEFFDPATPGGDPILQEAAPNGLCPTRGLDADVYPKRSRSDVEIVNYGLSAAFEFKLPPIKKLESTLSLGVGVSYYELELDSRVEFFSVRLIGSDCPSLVGPGSPGSGAGNEECRQSGGFFGPADYTPDNLELLDEEVGEDDDFGVNLGFLWRLGRARRWSIGGVFRQGPEFETEFFLDNFAGDPPNEPGTGAPSTVTIPDVYALGAAFRSAAGKTKITLDLNRVRYSQRLGDFVGNGISSAIDEPIREDFRIEDADQVHLGMETIVLVVESLFVGTVRVGVWNEPFHELEYIGPETNVVEREIARQTLRRPTDDELHLSLGLGLAIKEDYQIDVAVDHSDPVTTVSFSLVKFL